MVSVAVRHIYMSLGGKGLRTEKHFNLFLCKAPVAFNCFLNRKRDFLKCLYMNLYTMVKDKLNKRTYNL
jgi:hypothetical protein